MPHHPSPGFTLAELVVVLAIVGLLAAVAVPAYRETTMRRQLRIAAEELRADLDRARLLAITTGEPVHVIAHDGTRSWAGGWSARQRGGIVTSIGHPPLDAHFRTGRRQPSMIQFKPDGTVIQGHTLTLCARKQPATAMSIVIALAGRIRTDASDPADARDCAR